MNYYELLGISKTANNKEIKTAYHELIKQYHPDKHPNTPHATEMTQLLNEAYSVLKDPVKRCQYDTSLKFEEESYNSAYQEVEHIEQQYTSLNAACRCSSCGRQDETLRISAFIYVISILFVSFKRSTGGILCSRCRIKYSFLCNLELLLLGWWGFPWGIIWTLEGLFTNLSGGKQPKKDNASLLRTLGWVFYMQGGYSLAVKVLSKSLELQHNEDVINFLGEIKNYRDSSQIPEVTLWGKIFRLHPVFFSLPVFAVILVFFIYVSLLDFTSDDFDYSRSNTTTTSIQQAEQVKIWLRDIDAYYSAVAYLNTIEDVEKYLSELIKYKDILVKARNSTGNIYKTLQQTTSTDHSTTSHSNHLSEFYRLLNLRIATEIRLIEHISTRKQLSRMQLFYSQTVQNILSQIDKYTEGMNKEQKLLNMITKP